MPYFKAKICQIRFRLGLCPRPRWRNLQRSPSPLAGFKGPTSKGRKEWQGKREGKTEYGKGGKGRKERGEKGRMKGCVKAVGGWTPRIPSPCARCVMREVNEGVNDVEDER